MDPLRVLAEAQGFFTRKDVLAAGHDDNAIRAAVRCRLWVRVRRGAYTFSDLWHGGDLEAKHLVRAKAVAQRLYPNVALSHTSGSLVHAQRTWDMDLSKVHVTRLDGTSGRTEAGVVHHEGFCVESDVVEIDGVLATRAARSAVETASLGTTESGVVVLDSAKQQGCTDEEIAAAAVQLKHWPFTQSLQIAVRLSDGRAQSVGESRSHYLCYAHGLPAPVLQFEVYDVDGNLIGITDFAWPEHKLLGEFDGRIKYGRLLREGEQPGDAVFREKCREDALREVLGWQMIRLVWADLYRAPATAARIRRMLRIAA